jgi:hypothetical protein
VTSDPKAPSTGFIEPGLYRWWVGGILVGAVVLGLVACLLFPKSPLLALFATLGMAVIMLGTFDTRGNFRGVGLLVSAGGVGILYRILFHHGLPNRLLLALLAAVLLFLFSACGAIATTVGKARRNPAGR